MSQPAAPANPNIRVFTQSGSKRRNTRYGQMTSALAPAKDIQRLLRHVRFVPQNRAHSVTSYEQTERPPPRIDAFEADMRARDLPRSVARRRSASSPAGRIDAVLYWLFQSLPPIMPNRAKNRRVVMMMTTTPEKRKRSIARTYPRQPDRISGSTDEAYRAPELRDNFTKVQHLSLNLSRIEPMPPRRSPLSSTISATR
jgi:hypothetical protein